MNHPKTLIVGAGIAGLTLAALLKRRGQEPVIIEKKSNEHFRDAGYMLGLLPLGGRVLNALGLQAIYLAASCPMERYTIYDGYGKKIKTYPLTKIKEHFGPYRGISRGKLVKLLWEAPGSLPVRFSTTLQNITQDDAKVTVTFNDNTTARFDLVVICDGLHSTTRPLLWKEQEYIYKKTGWGGWVAWMDSLPQFHASYNEFWGAGFLLGTYPVKDKTGVFLGGPVERLQKIGCRAFAQKVHHKMNNPAAVARQALQSFETLEHPYFWDFVDCRTAPWRKGRVVLLGDAATGFLPTAGIGASMAMDSAAVLDDELSRADNKHLEYALQLYENRQRKKVERAQQESRKLGKWAFINSPAMAWVRNKTLYFYTLERLLKGFENLMLGN